jgi:hypothetical protein
MKMRAGGSWTACEEAVTAADVEVEAGAVICTHAYVEAARTRMSADVLEVMAMVRSSARRQLAGKTWRRNSGCWRKQTAAAAGDQGRLFHGGMTSRRN